MEMVTLWQELNTNLEEKWVCKEHSVLHKSKLESERVFEFLARLTREVFAKVRVRNDVERSC